MMRSAAAEGVLELSIAAIEKAVRSGRVSPVAIAEVAIDRMARVGPALGCLVTLARDRALEEARAAEQARHAGKAQLPLLGVPYGAKDNIDTRGVVTTWGSGIYASRVPACDSTVVRRATDSGAMLLGKLALTEFAMGVSDPRSSVTGACRNPWNLSHWAGGSSGGPAAAVAARLVTFALGTDTMGSLLGPAAFCGVTAIRPTYGVLSRSGVLPYAFSMDKVGVIARSAEDCGTVLRALAGRDPSDSSSIEAPPGLRASGHRSLRGLRAALLDWVPGAPVEPDLPVLLGEAVTVLEHAGMHVERRNLPDLPWAATVHVTLEAEAEVAFDDLIASGRVSSLLDPLHRGRPWLPLPGRPSDYVRAQVVRAGIQQAISRFQEEFDLILSVNSTLAPRVDGPLVMEGGDPMNGPGNLAGLPAATVPMGRAGPERMPVGLTITGRPTEDGLVLAVAAAFQSATSWHRERPPIADGP